MTGVAVDRTERMRLVLTGGRDGDQEELDELTLQLRERLLELDVEDVETVRSGDVPDGAKPADAIAVGALAVTLAPLALRSVLDLVRTWIENRPVRTVSVTLGDDSLELEAASSADQRRIVDAFLAAHAPEAEPADGQGE
ncbi:MULTISPECIES: hypothetical protein [unclassified Streptomyces]|uniref:hypothetical protein n=1 Tax=unclassified Streptomyces TaxID=2593676 RepID=UPI000ADEB091|nr:hypothetical protein [Streptomyces sp. NRRL S-37]